MKSLYESILSSTNSGKAGIDVGGYHIGDIVSAPFEYNSRFNNFYEVVTIKGKSTLVVKRLQTKIVKDDGYGQHIADGDDDVGKQQIKIRISRLDPVRHGDRAPQLDERDHGGQKYDEVLFQ